MKLTFRGLYKYLFKGLTLKECIIHAFLFGFTLYSLLSYGLAEREVKLLLGLYLIFIFVLTVGYFYTLGLFLISNRCLKYRAKHVFKMINRILKVSVISTHFFTVIIIASIIYGKV